MEEDSNTRLAPSKYNSSKNVNFNQKNDVNSAKPQGNSSLKKLSNITEEEEQYSETKDRAFSIGDVIAADETEHDTASKLSKLEIEFRDMNINRGHSSLNVNNVKDYLNSKK